MYDDDKAKLIAECDTLRAELAEEKEQSRSWRDNAVLANDRLAEEMNERMLATARAEKAEAELAAAKEQRGQLEALIIDAHFMVFGARQYAYVDPKSACALLVADITITQHEREKAEAENAELKVHVERMRGALECIPVDLINAIENGEKVRLFMSTDSCKLIGTALAATPAQSLAKLRADTLLEARSKLMPDVLGMGDYYAGMEAGIRSSMDTLQSMAERLEQENDNAK